MKKRGVQPLIATVLLIGFVLAIIVFIVIWSKGLVREAIDKSANLASGQLTCTTSIDIEVKSAECQSSNQGKIVVDAKNLINQDVPNLRGKVSSDSGTSLSFSGKVLKKFSRDKAILFTYDALEVGTPEFIEVIPMANSDAGLVTCDDQAVKVKIGNTNECS